MRVLQVNKYLQLKGGSETYMFSLGDELERMGHDVSYWGMTDGDVYSSDAYPKFIDFSTMSFFERIYSPLNTIYSRRNRVLFGRFIDDYCPDIIHIHNFNYQLTPSILLEGYSRNIPIVYTAHDSQLVCPFHRLYNFEHDTNCELCAGGRFYQCLKTKCFNGSLLKSALGTIESYLYHLTNTYNKTISRVISPSRFLAGLLSPVFDNDIEVVPNYTRDYGFFCEKAPYMVYVGRVSPEKGIVEAANLFSEQGIPLKVIGSGPSIDDIHESDFVEKMGVLSGQPLRDLVSNARYLIVPSKWYENCPMTIVEAYSHGTPVIGSDHSGVADMIEPEVNGYQLDFQRPDAGELLLKYYSEYDQLMPSRARESYDSTYSKTVHMDKIINIYRELLNESVPVA